MGLRCLIARKGMMVQTFQNGILKVKPFVIQWIVQMEEDAHELEVVEDHMLPWGVVGKEMCYCWFMLRLQKRKDID
jgi:hypothetical protein